ncbi:LuxR C-terminal-related transcriptional regulator [Flavobacterium sp.]|uniref:LuxR C-terminal-related transcriptional regulator n=1 Tax=Flavobacterium sp. TaxID=239 RepID=UPI002607E289|nr:LuxR C-terminal-related transcriptional regulator [Flavobacterium sp.]MDD3005155.1 LuxR C-terminal-related transcriptional regulator [Flavobacterium sp.]
MEKLQFDDMKKTWNEISRYQEKEMDIKFELEIHKKLLNIFQVGDYYYYIFNPAKAGFEYISENVKKVMKVENPEDFSPQYIFENMHPEDQIRFLANEQKVTEFFSKLTPEQVLKYKVSYDYRMKTTEGIYKWILMQTVTIQTNELGAVIRVIGVQTDITHLKTNNEPSGLSFLGLDGEPSYYNVPTDTIFTQTKEILSKREKEILHLIVQGHNSYSIASLLHISKYTVDTHRKNIIKKTNSGNVSELITKTFQNGWL